MGSRALRFLDRHPTSSVLGVSLGGTTLGYVLALLLCEGPVLLGRVPEGVRRDLYGSLAGTSGALLGFAVASLSILLALPDREAVARLRGFRAWRLLNQALLAAAAVLLLTLLLTTLALVLDDGASGTPWLQLPVTVLAVGSFMQLVVGGAAFALVILETVRAPT